MSRKAQDFGIIDIVGVPLGHLSTLFTGDFTIYESVIVC